MMRTERAPRNNPAEKEINLVRGANPIIDAGREKQLHAPWPVHERFAAKLSDDIPHSCIKITDQAAVCKSGV
jgi:hypothetical protein